MAGQYDVERATLITLLGWAADDTDYSIAELRDTYDASVGSTVTTKRSAAIVTPTAPGAGYVQAEAAAMKTAVDAIRAALIAAKITY